MHMTSQHPHPLISNPVSHAVFVSTVYNYIGMISFSISACDSPVSRAAASATAP